MRLLLAGIVRNSHILAGIYFYLSKKQPRPNIKGFLYQIWTSVKDRKSRYYIRQIYALSCKLVALTLG